MTTSDTERPENSPSQLVAAPIALTRQLEQLVDKRINILRRIHETGSISEAARLSNVSYKPPGKRSKRSPTSRAFRWWKKKWAAAKAAARN